MPAGYFYYLSGKHSRLLTCQEQDSFSDVLRLYQFPHWDQRDDRFFQFIIDPSGLSRSGCNTVHCDPILSDFESNAAGMHPWKN